MFSFLGARAVAHINPDLLKPLIFILFILVAVSGIILKFAYDNFGSGGVEFTRLGAAVQVWFY